MPISEVSPTICRAQLENLQCHTGAKVSCSTRLLLSGDANQGAKLSCTCRAQAQTEVALQLAASIELEDTVEVNCRKFSDVKDIRGGLICTACGDKYCRSITTKLSHECQSAARALKGPTCDDLADGGPSAGVCGSCLSAPVAMARLIDKVGR